MNLQGGEVVWMQLTPDAGGEACCSRWSGRAGRAGAGRYLLQQVVQLKTRPPGATERAVSEERDCEQRPALGNTEPEEYGAAKGGSQRLVAT